MSSVDKHVVWHCHASCRVSKSDVEKQIFIRCLPLKLNGKHCQKTHCRNGVVDKMFYHLCKSKHEQFHIWDENT